MWSLDEGRSGLRMPSGRLTLGKMFVEPDPGAFTRTVRRAGGGQRANERLAVGAGVAQALDGIRKGPAGCRVFVEES